MATNTVLYRTTQMYLLRRGSVGSVAQQPAQDKFEIIASTGNPAKLHEFTMEGLALNNPWTVSRVVNNNKTSENTLSMIYAQIKENGRFKGQTMLHQNDIVEYRDPQAVILESIANHHNTPVYLKTAAKELSSAIAKQFREKLKAASEKKSPATEKLKRDELIPVPFMPASPE